MCAKFVAPSLIPSGTALQCENCKAPLRAPRDIMKEEFPLETICPNCQAPMILIRTVLPKIDPSVAANARPLIIPHDVYGKEAPEIHESTVKAKEIPAIPFYETTSMIGENTAAIFTAIKKLKDEIEAYRLNVIDFFQNEWRYFTRFRDSWNYSHMQEWIDFPFTAFPALTDDPYSNKYARYVLSPKFFNPMFGFKVKNQAGGMRLELINQFSRMTFPLETFLCNVFSLPPNLDLKVVGNKIIGSTLQVCFNDIPGVMPDSDHTEQVASVYIKNESVAKKWLANHGINPWEARPIERKELRSSEVFQQITESRLFSDAWDKFRRYGRLGVFWSDANISRRFASLAAMSMMGTTVIFVASHKEEMAWDSLYTAQGLWRGGSDMAFVQNGEPLMWPQFMRLKSVVVDLHGPIDHEVLEKLFEYKGRLILIAPEPIMDYHTDNIECTRVHALAGFETFETPTWEDLPIKKAFFGKQLNALERSLKTITQRPY